MSYSVLIADDSSTVRCSIRSLIEVSASWKVCGEAENGAIAVEKARSLQPDVVILDLGMPVMNGLEAARHISRLTPHAAVVMFTMHANDHLAKVAEAAGISRVVSKAQGAEDLLEAINSLLAENRSPHTERLNSHRPKPAAASSSPAHQQQDHNYQP